MFVGTIAYNFDERIEQKIFHLEIDVDNAKFVAEIKQIVEAELERIQNDENLSHLLPKKEE